MPNLTFEIGKTTETWAKTSKLAIFYEQTLASTNDFAKEIAFMELLTNSPMALVLTDHQTNGRGRGANLWVDAKPGSALLSSWIFQLPTPPKPVTTCRVGLAVEKALTATWPWLPLSLKAPNDIYLGTQKLGGILIENLQQGGLDKMIVGIGLNIWEHPAIPIATSLVAHLDPTTIPTRRDWLSFLDRLLMELFLAVSHSSNDLTAMEQKALLYSLNKKPDLSEKYIAIEADGSLILPSKRIRWSDL